MKKLICVFFVFALCLSSVSALAEAVGTHSLTAIFQNEDTGIFTVDLISETDSLLLLKGVDSSGALQEAATASVPAATGEQSVALSMGSGYSSYTAYLLDRTTLAPLCDPLTQAKPDYLSYSVGELTVSEGQILATVNAERDCHLFVEVLSEDENEVLTRAEAAVAGSPDSVSVALVPEDAAPLSGYFVLKAWLVDGSGRVASQVYTSNEYTQSFQEFLAKTAADYDPAYTFDYGSDGYAVARSDAKLVYDAVPVEGADDTYRFPDDGQQIQAGDVIVVTMEDGERATIKVKSAVSDGEGGLIVTADDEVYLSDLYSAINYTITDGMDVYAASGSVKGFPMSISGKVALGDNSEFTIEYKGSITPSGSLRYDKNHPDDFQFKLNAKLELEGTMNAGMATTNLNAFGSPKHNPPTLFTSPKILLGAPAFACLQIQLTFPISYRIEGKGSAKFRITKEVGMELSQQNKPVFYHPDGESESSFSLEGGFSVSAGPEFIVKLSPVHTDVISAKLFGKCGVTAEGKDKAEWSSESGRHGCYVCTAYDIKFTYEAAAEADWKISKKLSGTLVKITFCKGSIPLKSGYASFASAADSLFGGAFHADKGKCPNYAYKLSLLATDQNGNLLNGWSVRILKDGQPVESGKAPLSAYLYPGDYVAEVEFPSGTISMPFVMGDAPFTLRVAERWVNITLDGNGGTVTPDRFRIGAGSSVTEGPEAVRNGHRLTGWSLSANGSGADASLSQCFFDDTTLYAQWERIVYANVAFDAGGGSVSEASRSVEQHTKIGALPAASRQGYLFKGWSLYPAGSPLEWFIDENYVVDQSMTLYAIWRDPEICKLRGSVLSSDLSPVPNARITCIGTSTYSTTADADGRFELSLPEGSYTVFASGLNNASKAVNVNVKPGIDGDVTITLNASCTVRFDTNSANPLVTIQHVTAGEAIGTLPDYTRSGYVLTGWNTRRDGTGTAVTENTRPTQDMTAYAIWKPRAYTVTFNGNGGRVSFDSVDGAAGMAIGTLPEATRGGYIFVEWNTAADGSGTAVNSTTVPTGDIEVFAIWRDSVYYLYKDGVSYVKFGTPGTPTWSWGIPVTAVFRDDGILLNPNYTQALWIFSGISTQQAIDRRGYNKLCVKYDVLTPMIASKNGTAAHGQGILEVSPSKGFINHIGDRNTMYVYDVSVAGEATATLDISAYPSYQYFTVLAYTARGDGYTYTQFAKVLIKEIYLSE